MRQQFGRVAFGIVLGVLLVSSSLTATAATEPTVTALVEGRDVASGRSTLVILGKGVSKFASFALRDTGGADVGPVEAAVTTSTMLVLRLPAGTPLGSYDLVLGFGKTGQQTRRITLTNGTGNPPGTPTSVSVVESVPVAVTAPDAPLPVAVSSMPAVAVASLPSVNVASLPAVTITSLPAVSITGQPLDVRLVNTSIATTPASNAAVTLTDLNGVTVSSNFTSGDIDCDGYRALSVFVGHDAYAGTSMTMAIEFQSNGVWAWEGSDNGTTSIASSRQSVSTSDVLGSRVRIRLFTTVAVTNVKVVVYLRR